MSTPFGAQSAWRQLVDLIGRGRIPPSDGAIEKLKSIRAHVSPSVRAASARGVAFADPPVALVRLFADDDLAIAAPVLRMARLHPQEWIEMLPGLSPGSRSILRHRRDLPPSVLRALESFGSIDFVLSDSNRIQVAPIAGAGPVESAFSPEPLFPTGDVEPVEAAEAAPTTPGDARAGTIIDWTAVIDPQAEDLTPALIAEASAPEAVESEPMVGPEALPETEAEPSAVEPDMVEPGAALPDVERDGAPQITPAVTPIDSESVDLPAPAPVDSSFVSVASVALGLPIVAEALRQSGSEPSDTASVADPELAPEAPAVEAATTPEPDEAGTTAFTELLAEPVAPLPSAEITTLRLPPAEAATGVFQIAELVARIEAFQRHREQLPVASLVPAEIQPELFDLDPVPARSFRFETDASGVVRWVEGAARAPLIGLSLGLAALPSGSRVDGVAAGAFRRRAGFSNARLVIEGSSDAAGQWRITGIPVFDRESGRFIGYRGTARRPRADESAEPIRASADTDGLRQLVHELRTPTNAIAGFAEMIESQMLGPVPQAYRAHAAVIRTQAAELLTAIDDIDMAARIESRALDLRASDVAVRPLLDRIAADLAPLATLRGAVLDLYTGSADLAIDGDDRAVERLIARLMATLVASGGAGERIGISAALDSDAMVAIMFDRPRALAAYSGDALLSIDVETESEREGAPLLGTGFALRLARNLAAELRGTLEIGDNALTLRLPAAVIESVEQVSQS